MAHEDDVFNSKNRFLIERELALSKKVKTLENQMFKAIVDNYLISLDTVSGVIESNTHNINLTNNLNEVFDRFNNSKQLPVIESFAKDLLSVSGYNKQYFELIAGEVSKFNSISESAQKSMRERIGINAKGSLNPKGFLSSFINDTSVRNSVKQMSYDAVSGRQGVGDLRLQLKRFIVSNPSNTGQLERHYKRFAYDTFQEFDRIESGSYATALRMDAFVYSGGTISDSRDFCIHRNNRVFTTKEAESWGRNFQGNKPGNILTVLGGYGCRHSKKHITNQSAARRRKDLELSDDGRLVYAKGVKRQTIK